MKKKYAGPGEVLDIQILSMKEKECPPLLPKNAHRNARMRKAWKDRASQIITPEATCSICGGKKTLQIHHETKEAYKAENFHLYETLSPLLPFKIICKKCHFVGHNNLKLCKVCGENHHQRHYETCFVCSGKESTDIFKAIGFDRSMNVSFTVE